jgi:hypothetical protein
MAYRSWITCSFPTHVIFRYHLPLKKRLDCVFTCIKTRKPVCQKSEGELDRSSHTWHQNIYYAASMREISCCKESKRGYNIWLIRWYSFIFTHINTSVLIQVWPSIIFLVSNYSVLFRFALFFSLHFAYIPFVFASVFFLVKQWCTFTIPSSWNFQIIEAEQPLYEVRRYI